jgi:chromosome segregation ATPase
VDHVQTPELLAIQKEKEKLIEVIAKLNEQIFSLQQQIQVLKQGIPSSSSDGTFAGSSEELARALTDLNAKEIELDESRRTVSTYETEINLLKEHIGEKERQLKKIQGSKEKLQEEYDTLKTKLSGKPYLMGARHLIWDKIMEHVNKMWKCFIIMEEEANLVKKVEKDIAKVEQELGDKPQVANKIIRVLNSKTKEELNQIGVKDRTSTIMDFEKVLTKRNLIQQVQSKLVHLQRNVQWYKIIIKRWWKWDYLNTMVKKEIFSLYQNINNY